LNASTPSQETESGAVAQPAAPRPGLCLAIGVVLVATTLLLFGRTAWENFAFLRYDDQQYIVNNERVRGGLSWEGIVWAFRPSTVVVANWHPVTLLSHMLDCQVFGMWSGGHHLTSVLWHATNAGLLFALLVRMTGRVWPSALVAALFAWHPLRAESVAWIAERKDVLSTFFWLLMLWAYVSYVRRPAWWTYLPVVLWLALGLMSKPMLVTAPFLLLLLDYWPLERFRTRRADEDLSELGQRLLEKLPLLALTVVFCAATLEAQSRARVSWEVYSLETRLLSALQSYVGYLYLAAWPAELATPYLMSARVVTAAAGLSCGALLLAVSVACLYFRRRFPYLPVGWFWYLGTLVPVIGLVQVGVQSLADRYTYVPLIGLSLIVAWGLADLVGWAPRLKPLVVALVIVWLGILAGLTYRQVGFWRDKVTLFAHTVEVLPNNHVARLFLGSALKTAGRPADAIEQFDKAIELGPDMYQGHQHKGLVLYETGRHGAAATEFARAVRLSRTRMKPEVEYAAAMLAAKVFAAHPDEAERNPAAAIEMAEHACEMTGYQFSEALDVLGMAYANAGRYRQAIARTRQAYELYVAGNELETAAKLAERIRLYEQEQPYREAPQKTVPLPGQNADE